LCVAVLRICLHAYFSQPAAAVASASCLSLPATPHTNPAGDFETKLGLVILASLSFNLTYENALLVAGRYIGKDSNGMELLQELSKWRFLAHSGAPLALIAGLNMAGRAGVEWAANPYWEGLIGLLILAVVAVSSVRNSFFLEITPVWNRGILRYSYAPGAADFTKIIPVIITTLVLVILGWQSYQRDAALLPFFVGPLVAFVLNALPASKDGETGNKLPPQFVLGNGGEVALFAGLVATEVLLHMQGK
jgi:energy-converting hydrogenase Eha subunit A